MKVNSIDKQNIIRYNSIQDLPLGGYLWSIVFLGFTMLPMPASYPGAYYYFGLMLLGFSGTYIFARLVFTGFPSIKVSFLLLSPVIYFLVEALSWFCNSTNYSFSGMITRPASRLLCYVFGFVCFSVLNHRHATRVVEFTCYIGLLIQTIICVIQFGNPHYFDFLWSSDKTSIIRVTGSLFNPNIFAFIVVVLFSFIYLKAHSFFLKTIITVVTCGLVLLSGSRTNLIILPALYVVMAILTEKISFKLLIRSFLTGLGLAFLLLFLLFYFSDLFVYAATFLDLIFSFNETDNGLTTRFLMWKNGFEIMWSGNLMNFLFGVGKHPGVQTIDNDYVSVFVKNGLVGIAWHMTVITMFLLFGLKNSQHLLGKWLVCIVVAIIIQGFTSEALSKWLYSVLFWLIAGSISGYNSRQTKDSKAVI